MARSTSTTVYVKAFSKKELNARIREQQQTHAGCVITGLEYMPTSIRPIKLVDLPDGSIIKLFREFDTAGNPISRSIARWNAPNKRVL